MGGPEARLAGRGALRRRHPHFFIGMAETEEKLRLVGTAGQESRAGVTAREEPRAGVEP
jgi:hypothetical protein